jgi:hypothetical protein
VWKYYSGLCFQGGIQSLQISVHPSQAFMGPPARSFQGRLVHSNARHGRKDKVCIFMSNINTVNKTIFQLMQDGVSTLSADSGNVHDYIESSDAKHYIPKSKSMPNYGDLQTVEPYAIQSKHALNIDIKLLIKILQLYSFDD